MTDVTTTQNRMTIGIDLGDRFSQFCVLDGSGAALEEGRLTMSEALSVGAELAAAEPIGARSRLRPIMRPQLSAAVERTAAETGDVCAGVRPERDASLERRIFAGREDSERKCPASEGIAAECLGPRRALPGAAISIAARGRDVTLDGSAYPASVQAMPPQLRGQIRPMAHAASRLNGGQSQLVPPIPLATSVQDARMSRRTARLIAAEG